MLAKYLARAEGGWPNLFQVTNICQVPSTMATCFYFYCSKQQPRARTRPRAIAVYAVWPPPITQPPPFARCRAAAPYIDANLWAVHKIYVFMYLLVDEVTVYSFYPEKMSFLTFLTEIRAVLVIKRQIAHRRKALFKTLLPVVSFQWLFHVHRTQLTPK